MQTLLGHIERWLAYSQAPLENSAGEKVNGLTPILADVDEFQPRKVEELVPEKNIAPDTYLIYPNGGYHPFYGVSNTLPIYQQKIWPYVKRIKYHEKWKGKEHLLNKVRKNGTREDHLISQINPYLFLGYPRLNLFRTETYLMNKYTHKKKDGQYYPAYKNHKKTAQLLHRLVALAFIPNPENKPFVLHGNDDTTNYLRENLKWGTQRENQKGKIGRRPDTVEQKYQILVNQGIIKG